MRSRLTSRWSCKFSFWSAESESKAIASWNEGHVSFLLIKLPPPKKTKYLSGCVFVSFASIAFDAPAIFHMMFFSSVAFHSSGRVPQCRIGRSFMLLGAFARSFRFFGFFFFFRFFIFLLSFFFLFLFSLLLFLGLFLFVSFLSLERVPRTCPVKNLRGWFFLLLSPPTPSSRTQHGPKIHIPITPRPPLCVFLPGSRRRW